MSNRIELSDKAFNRSGKSPQKNKSAGFSMLEVLISVLILAIGLLGVASTQVLSVQQTTNSQLRSQATMYAEVVVNKVRFNDGEMIPTNELNRIKAEMQRDMGPGADVSASISGNTLDVTVSWSEKDPFSDDGDSSESFNLKARLEQ